VGVAEGDGPAVGTACGVLGLAQFGEQPVDLGAVERHVDLDGGVAGDAGGDPAASGLGVFGLLLAIWNSENLFEHPLQLAAFESYGSGLDGDGVWAERLGLEAVALQLVGEAGIIKNPFKKNNVLK